MSICIDNYITPNIFLRDNKLYYKKPTKEIKIGNNNWHKYLEEYGWEKLHLNWIKRLNKSIRCKSLNKSASSSKKEKRKNSLFGVLDCGGSGDCFFSCVIESLNSERDVYDKYDVKMLRAMLAGSITEDKFKPMIEHYRILNDIGEFHDEWDPHKVDNVEELKAELVKEGTNFLADYIILQLFQQLFSINVIILNSTQFQLGPIKNKSLFKLYNTGIRYSKDNKTIILSYEDEQHFRLVGHLQNNNMITLFNNTTLPDEMFNIIDADLIKN
jgi:hypothetical protein